MLDRAREAMDLTKGMTKEGLERNRVLFLAVIHLVEIVGEAANRVPRDVQDGYPEIEWKDVISVRNRLIHGYDKVDTDVLWGIITIDLPRLAVSLEARIGKDGP